MKHIVNLVVSQPDHDFVSMRSRRQEKTLMQEAASAEEAINRATRRMRSLGFMVHGASIVEQKQEAPAAKPLTEGVAETQTAVAAAQEKQKAAKKKATAEVDKSEVQDKAGKAQAGSALAQYLKNKASTMKEEVEVTSGYLEEKLSAADPASKWIHDFVHSDNPKFEGKSKAERIKMALGAKYAADRALKEDAEQVEEGRAMDYKMSRSSIAGDRGDSKGGEINVSQKDREEIAKILGAKDDKKQDKKLEEAEQVEEGVKIDEADKLEGLPVVSLSDFHDKKDYKKDKYGRSVPKKLKKDDPRVKFLKVKEEVEQVDELNKSTLKSYIKKASSDMFRKGTEAEARFRGKDISGSMKTGKKADVRQKGIDTAVEKLAKEEVEQIDELNKETLASYVGKAAQSVGTKERIAKGLAVNAATTTSKKKRDMYLKSAQTWRDAAARRVAGIKTAAEKLAVQEDTQLEEAKADPVAKAKELLDQAEKGTYKGSAAKLQKALEKAKSRNFDQGKGYKLEEDAEQLDETGIVKKTNKTLKNVMAASKGAKINAAMGDAKMDPADYGYNKAQHLNKAIGRMVSRGAAFVEEDVEQLDEKSQEAKQKKAWGKTLARIRGARIMKDSGITPQNIDLKTKQGKYYTQKDLNLQAGRAAQKGDLDEAAEGTAPSTPKEKELAAKAGDPNKITKKDVLAARGVKLDEVKGSFKDQATEKAEDKRLAKKETKDSKSAKAAETVINLAKSKKNKINTTPSIEAHHTMGGK